MNYSYPWLWPVSDFFIIVALMHPLNAAFNEDTTVRKDMFFTNSVDDGGLFPLLIVPVEICPLAVEAMKMHL